LIPLRDESTRGKLRRAAFRRGGINLFRDT
jgi:hypothetical protein